MLSTEVYNISTGMTIAIIFEFIVLIYHANTNKKEKFIMWWALGMGLTVVGLLSVHIGDSEPLYKLSLILSNAFTILGQGAFFVSIEIYLNKSFKIDRKNRILTYIIAVLIYFSVFIEIRTIRMISTSIVLFTFSTLIIRRLFLAKTKDNKEDIIFLMVTFGINAFYWIIRMTLIIFLLPYKPEAYNGIVISSYAALLFICTLGTLGLILLMNKNLMNQNIEEKLIVDKERLKFLTILETSPDLVLVTNLSDGKIEVVNKALLDMLGFTYEEIVGKTTLELNIWDSKEDRIKFVTALQVNNRLINYESIIVKKDGSKFLGSMSVSTIEINDILYSIAMVRDISEIRKIENKIKQSEKSYKELSIQLKKEKEVAEKNALTDGMTGLANRRYLDEQLMLEYFRMKRTREYLSVIMLDVDYFKLYNDAYGHIQGDECLKSIAKILKNSIKRATDIAARYGGEEFVILLPDTDEKGAKKVAEIIRKNVEDLEMEHKDSKISEVVTISLGVATFGSQSDIAPERMIQKADEALYQAKSQGRNRVIQITRSMQLVDETSFLKVVWSPNFESGDKEIDNQHKKLFEDANKIFESLLSLKSKEEQLKSIMDIVSDLKEHFNYEEKILSDLNYLETSYHAALHSHLLENVDIFVEKFKNDEVKVVDLLNFLIFEVIADHLYREDRVYFSFLKEAKLTNKIY